ncbi:ATP-binding protein [Oleiagrimonas sp. C23AA]|uniref:ATP-binding protein n=1 Tax=Oleiagrimonas sp. C23AA TaxID=2719047 RepID=UPI001422182C|nr:ATP-binding protein [Oleiagrimonas sp. C23AA]NII11289.1 NACHT domain-containing protein [Oleiagrimonas sp. C23AA]
MSNSENSKLDLHLPRPAIKAAAIPRLGYEYQDLAGIEVLLRQYRDPALFNWVKLEADDSQFKALDDVVAERVDGTYEFVQVKFTVDSGRYELDWDWLLHKSKNGTSMLAKWAKSFARVAAMGTIHSACLKTNRPPSSEFQKSLIGNRVSLERLDKNLRKSLEAECGGAAEAKLFFDSFDFLGERPGFDEYERQLRDQIVPADTDPLGWFYFRHHVRTWATSKDQPSPGGKILREHVAQVINKRRPQPLRQDFVVPDGYLPPSSTFYETIRGRLKDNNPLTVLWGTPGRGKSTFLSHLTLQLQEEGAVVLRHHYFLPAEDSVSDRTSFTDIVSSLLEQLRTQHSDAMDGVSEDDREFRRSMGTAAENLAREGKRLYIVIDGLDHVWRDNKRVDQLNHLFNELLPVPPNLSLIVGTQRVPDEQLPSKLLTLVTDDDWQEIPAMEQAVVHCWLSHLDHARPLLLRFDPTPERRSELISEIADALFQISQGHPLHLIYAYEQLVRSGTAVSADDVNALDPCPDGDIRTYYKGLWVRLSATAKNALHMLAGSGFYWPSLGIRQVLGDFSEIDHLLEPRRFGMVPFHSSVFAWVRERPDHEESHVALLPKIVAWLESDAPEYWRWGWLWLTKARAGDFADLLAGTNRDWVIDSMSSGWPSEQIEDILAAAEEKCFLEGDLPGTVRRRSLKIRVSNGRGYQARDFPLFLATALAVSGNRQQTYNAIDAPYVLSDAEVGAIARFGPSDLQTETLPESLSELARRINTWIALRHRPHGEFTKLIDQLISVSALMEASDVNRVLLFILSFKAPEPFVGKLVSALGNARNLAGLQLVISRLEGDSWAKQRARVLDEIIRFTGFSGTDARQLISGADGSISPFAAYWFISRGHDLPSKVCHADVPAGLIRDRYSYGLHQELTCFFCESFWSALYVALRAAGAEYTLIPQDLGGDPGWARLGLKKLEEIASKIATGLTTPDFAAVYDGSADLAPVVHGPSPKEDYSQYIAFCEALRRISIDLHLVTSNGGRVAEFTLRSVRRSLHWSDEIWVARTSESRMPILEPAAAAVMLADEATKLQLTVVEFNERSERWTLLADVARLYGDTKQSAYLRHAAECLVGYGWRKDLGALEVLDAISTVHMKDASTTRDWLETVTPIVNVITEFTDGDETNHVRSELIEVVSKRLPRFLPALFDHHIEADEHSYADECFIEFVESMDLELEESRSIARTLVDARTLNALEKRAAGDGVARRLFDDQIAFLGGRPSLPRRYEADNSETRHDSSQEQDPTSFGPDAFPDVVSAADVLDYKERGGFIVAWLNHCRDQGLATRALHSIGAYFDSSESTYGADMVLDEAFRISLEVEGKDAAYPWLVKAHIHRHGWQSWYTSEKEALARLEQAATHYADRWFSYIRDTSLPAPYFRRRRHGLVIGYKYLVRFLVLAGQVEIARDVTNAFVTNLVEEVREQPIPSTPWFKPNSAEFPMGFTMLLKRLKWPVPMARFRVAREIRGLLENETTRPTATAALLDHLENSRYESETCEILNVLMLTSDEARPPHSVVTSRIKHPSILADCLLERMYGPGEAKGGWARTYSNQAPVDFEPSDYFEEHKTAHVPPVYRNHLEKLQSQSGFPFAKQWAFEWEAICESLGTHYTRYPYFFGDVAEVRAGLMGQYWQRIHEAYLSAYLRTLAFAVCELGLPQHFAEGLCFEMIHGIDGLHDLNPISRPAWLGDFPERACVAEDDLEAIARDFINHAEFDGLRLVSLTTPIAFTTANYARLEISSHFVSPDFVPKPDPSLHEMPRNLLCERFKLEGCLSELPLEVIETNGLSGTEFSVCVELTPIPFGSWQGDFVDSP